MEGSFSIFLAQPPHRDAQIFNIADMRLAPDRAKQVTMGQHLTRVSGEFGQQRKLLLG